MKFFNLIPYYFAWHYTGALNSILKIWSNYIWFVSNYFSLKIIFFSFFKPYKVINEKNHYKKEEEISIVTFIMRMVGVVMRFAVIFLGLLTLILSLILGLIIFLIWLAAPVILIVILLMGVIAIIN